jgi:hypothetical protein
MNAFTNMDFARKLVLCGFFLFTIGLAQSSAQGEHESRVMFVEFVDLNAAEYAKISQALETNEDFRIKHACVPVGIVMFEIPQSNSSTLDQNFIQLRGLLVNTTSLQEMRIIAEYSEEDFLARCRQFRGGNAQ